MRHAMVLLAVAALLIGVIASGNEVFAKAKVCKDGTPPPCKPAGGEAAANNLSFPVIISDNVHPTGWVDVTTWSFAPITDDGTGVPIGCVGEDDIVPPAKVDPSILCYYGRKNLGLDEVTGEPVLVGSPQVWWLQQRTPNKWQVWHPVDPDTLTPVAITAIDWGDLLESSGNLNQKQIRTEMTLLQNVDADPDFNLFNGESTVFGSCPDPTVNCFAAFAMSGAVPGTDQSIAEIQGTDYGPGIGTGDFSGTRTMIDPRTVKSDSVTGIGFDATVYSRCARLVVQRITGDPTLPVWDSTTGHWEGPDVTNPIIDLPAYTNLYTAEINAGGSMIFGYNWNTKTFQNGTGIYRLTFVLDGSTRCGVALNTVFDADTIVANPGNINYATLVPFDDAMFTAGEGGMTYVDAFVTVKVKSSAKRK